MFLLPRLGHYDTYLQGTSSTAYCRADHYVNKQIFRSASQQIMIILVSILNYTIYFFKFLSLERERNTLNITNAQVF